MQNITTTEQARPKLLSIDHDGPVYLREFGKGWNGIEWTVQPENFDTLIERINENGGPDFWTVVPVED